MAVAPCKLKGITTNQLNINWANIMRRDDFGRVAIPLRPEYSMNVTPIMAYD
jgi:hypothetical protein